MHLVIRPTADLSVGPDVFFAGAFFLPCWDEGVHGNSLFSPRDFGAWLRLGEMASPVPTSHPSMDPERVGEAMLHDISEDRLGEALKHAEQFITTTLLPHVSCRQSIFIGLGHWLPG
jgi:hypothetical protein